MGDDRINASIEGKAGVGGEIGAVLKIFGFEIADWRTYFDIGPQWTIFKFPDDGSGSSGGYDPNNGGGGKTNNAVYLNKLNSNYTAKDGDVLTGTLSGNYKISIADGATVTLKNVTIAGTDSRSYEWAGINCVGNATIVLEGTNNVRGFYSWYPGIHVPKSSTLTIKGDGSLTATSNGDGAGIGAGIYVPCGNIIIEGGTITATGGRYDGYAGIGGGYQGTCGNITIKGGTVTATGSQWSPGIGGGYWSTCGNITITNGVTSVTAIKGGGSPCSIGRANSGSCGTVTIGGKVYADGISTSPYTYKP
jgi:hypothetical protein